MMRKIILRLLFALLLVTVIPHSQGAGTRHARDILAGAKYVSGEVLVKLSSQRSFAVSRQNISDRFSARQAIALNDFGLTKVKLRDGLSVADGVEELRRDPSVEFVQPNFIYHLTALPNDTEIGNQWGVKNTNQTVADSAYATNNPPGVAAIGKDMDLATAWDTITDCSSIKVAVIDSGVNYTQEDLTANLWTDNLSYPKYGYDFVDGDIDPMDGNGHGTHVSGTIGAVGNNAKGVAGVCWKAKIMALKVFDATGSGGTTANIVSAIDFAIAQGAKVINMSLSGSSPDALQEAAILRASNAGIVIVAAAGNGGDDGLSDNNDVTPSYPCNSAHANVICVAALDQAYALSAFSNYGLTSVDIGAPGTNIVSSWNGAYADVAGLTAFPSWTFFSANWGSVTCTLSGVSTAFLGSPGTYCNGGGAFTNDLLPASIQSTAHFNSTVFTGYSSLMWTFDAFVDLDETGDTFAVGYRKVNGNPFATGGNGVVIDIVDGTSGGFSLPMSYDITACQGANCSLGLYVGTNATQGAAEYGVGVFNMHVKALTVSTSTYDTINGTSMATPHVTGLVAMLRAYNPNYSMADVIASVKGGGVTAAALSGITVTGKAASASGSLNYIIPPTGLLLANKP